MATARSAAVRKRPPWKRLVRALLIFAGIPYLGILLLLALLHRSLIYGHIRDDTLNSRPGHITNARIEPISLTTDGNLRLNGWHVVSEAGNGHAAEENARQEQGRPLILYFCGNAANRKYRAEEFEIFAS